MSKPNIRTNGRGNAGRRRWTGNTSRVYSYIDETDCMGGYDPISGQCMGELASTGNWSQIQNYQNNPQMMAFIRQNGWSNMPMGWILCKLCETFGPNDCSGWCTESSSAR